MKQHYISLFVLTTLLVCTNSYGHITGKAWQDHNANGEIEIVESGQAQLTVRAYDTQGKMVTSAVTDAQGYYRPGCSAREAGTVGVHGYSGRVLSGVRAFPYAICDFSR